MNPLSLAALGSVFKAIAAALGLGSGAALLVDAAAWINLWPSRPAPGHPSGTALAFKADALLLMATGIAKALALLANALGSLAQWLLQGLIAAALCGLLAATLMWFTGRGLQAQAEWARWCAGLLCSLALLATLLAWLLLVALNSDGGAWAGPPWVGGMLMAQLVGLLLSLQAIWAGYRAP